MLSLFILVSVASATSSYLSKVDNAYVYVEILNRCLPTVYNSAQVYARTTLNEDGETYTTKDYADDECRIPLSEGSSSSIEGTEQGELPVTVAYILKSSDENCEKDDLEYIEGYRTGCNPYITGETTYYVQSSVSSGQLTIQAYTDEECNSPLEESSDTISKEYECDTCIPGEDLGRYFTVYCEALTDSIFGTGSTKDPEEYDANTIQELKSKAKYVGGDIFGMIMYYESNKCMVSDQSSRYFVIPTPETMMMCEYRGSTTCEAPEGTQLYEVCDIQFIDEPRFILYNKHPKNIAHMEMSIDEECNDLDDGVGMIFPEGCQQIENINEVIGSVNFVVEEGKVKRTVYLDGECTTVDEESTTDVLTCDSCVKVDFLGKVICEPLSGGAFNTFLLLALVLIAFIF